MRRHRDNPGVVNVVVPSEQADKSDSNYEICTSLWGVVLDIAVFLCHLAFCVTFELMISYQKFIFNL